MSNLDFLSFKEKARMFWLVKGHINTSKDTIEASANGYFKRLWYDESGCMETYGERFEEEYSKRFEK